MPDRENSEHSGSLRSAVGFTKRQDHAKCISWHLETVRVAVAALYKTLMTSAQKYSVWSQPNLLEGPDILELQLTPHRSCSASPCSTPDLEQCAAGWPHLPSCHTFMPPYLLLPLSNMALCWPLNTPKGHWTCVSHSVPPLSMMCQQSVLPLELLLCFWALVSAQEALTSHPLAFRWDRSLQSNAMGCCLPGLSVSSTSHWWLAKFETNSSLEPVSLGTAWAALSRQGEGPS